MKEKRSVKLTGKIEARAGIVLGYILLQTTVPGTVRTIRNAVHYLVCTRVVIGSTCTGSRYAAVAYSHIRTLHSQCTGSTVLQYHRLHTVVQYLYCPYGT